MMMINKSRIRKLYLNEKGLTLVELMISSLVLLMVLAVGFLLLTFAMRSFDTGTAQAGSQQQAKIVDEYFKSELRNAVEIKVQSSEEADWNYFELDGNELKQNGNPVTSADISNIEMKVIKEGGKFILKYKIVSLVDGQEYTFKNELLLNNINSVDEDLKELFDVDTKYLNYHDDMP